MDLEYLTMDIKYEIDKDKFKITGDMNKQGQYNVVEAVLRGQVGAGEDKSKANVKDVYNIKLKWYPENDKFEIYSDTGNKGLRDGILSHLLMKLEKGLI